MRVRQSLTSWFETHATELDAVIFDVDGVVSHLGPPIPGAVRMLSRLKEINLPYVFLTNDGNHSPQEKSQAMRRNGLPIGPEEIVSCGHALQDTASELGLIGQPVFVLGDLGSPSFGELAGITEVRDPNALPSCRAMILSEENYDWEEGINLALNFLREHPGFPLIILNPDNVFPRGAGRVHIGAGGLAKFIQMILAGLGVSLEPIYLGKPHRPVYKYIQRRLQGHLGRPVEKNRLLMVGDNLQADIQGALNFGCRSALVLTGLTDLDSLAASPIRPEMVFQGP